MRTTAGPWTMSLGNSALSDKHVHGFLELSITLPGYVSNISFEKPAKYLHVFECGNKYIRNMYGSEESGQLAGCSLCCSSNWVVSLTWTVNLTFSVRHRGR
jgi:hypothetical protein